MRIARMIGEGRRNSTFLKRTSSVGETGKANAKPVESEK